MGNSTMKRLIAAALGVVLGACFILLCPDVGLGEQGVRCLGILLGAVVWWVGGVLPSYGSAIVMAGFSSSVPLAAKLLEGLCAGKAWDVADPQARLVLRQLGQALAR